MHKPDLWNIPLYHMSINPSYQFYLGHHTLGLNETVLILYANQTME